MDGIETRTRTRKTPNTSALKRATTTKEEENGNYGKTDDDAPEIKASSPSRAKSVVCSFVVMWLFVVENFVHLQREKKRSILQKKMKKTKIQEKFCVLLSIETNFNTTCNQKNTCL